MMMMMPYVTVISERQIQNTQFSSPAISCMSK